METSLTRHYGGRNPRLHSVPVNPKSEKNVFASGRQKRHLSPCLHFCCTNNRIIISFLCVRKFRARKLASSTKKRGVQINRVYELLEILRYFFFFSTDLIQSVFPHNTPQQYTSLRGTLSLILWSGVRCCGNKDKTWKVVIII